MSAHIFNFATIAANTSTPTKIIQWTGIVVVVIGISIILLRKWRDR